MYNEFKRTSSADTVIFYVRVRTYSGVELRSSHSPPTHWSYSSSILGTLSNDDDDSSENVAKK